MWKGFIILLKHQDNTKARRLSTISLVLSLSLTCLYSNFPRTKQKLRKSFFPRINIFWSGAYHALLSDAIKQSICHRNHLNRGKGGFPTFLEMPTTLNETENGNFPCNRRGHRSFVIKRAVIDSRSCVSNLSSIMFNRSATDIKSVTHV